MSGWMSSQNSGSEKARRWWTCLLVPVEAATPQIRASDAQYCTKPAAQLPKQLCQGQKVCSSAVTVTDLAQNQRRWQEAILCVCDAPRCSCLFGWPSCLSLNGGGSGVDRRVHPGRQVDTLPAPGWVNQQPGILNTSSGRCPIRDRGSHLVIGGHKVSMPWPI